MEPVSEQQDRVLTQSTNALTFIHLQLVELTRDSGNMLQNGPASLQNLLELQNKLEKILHETRVACRPPLRKPVMSDFETVGQIGQGGFATVDLVAHKVTGQKFAMKKIKRKKVTKDVRDQVLLERDILTFANNPFVVSMFCYFETETHLCMVLEHAGGGDCAKILEMHGRLPVDLARIYSAETVLALEYIHSYGILHRDLKPNNLLISSIGHIKLADFGLSKIGPVNMSTNLDQNYINTASQEFGDEDMRCTPLYVAPEMILQLGYGEPMDWWSLGIVLYEFLVGTVPFLAEDVEEIFEKVLEDKVPWPTGKDILPVDAHSLIRRLLDKNHMTRLGTGGAVKVKKHPFFQDVPWNNLLDLNVPIMKSKRSTSKSHQRQCSSSDPSSDEGFSDKCLYCEGYCEKVSSNGGSSDGESSEEDGSPCQVSDFGYVAFRFKEVYGSPGYLSLSNLSLSEHHQVPETISEDRHDEAVEKPTSVRMDPVSEQPKTDCVSNVRNIIHLKLEKMKRLVTGSRIMKKREIIHRLKKDS